MLETQIQQITATLSRQSNGDPYQIPVQESMKYIFTVFKGKAPKSSGWSLGVDGPRNAMTPDKGPSAAENFSAKSTQRVKEPKSSGTETVLLTDLKCDDLTRKINQ
jgi:hypothetical protein